MKNPAREKFLPMLSPYVDGELSPEERAQVEQHLQNNKESAMQVADMRAADGLMRLALEMQGDDVDWKKFTEDVMGKITPDRLPLFERLKLTLSEAFTYQRGAMMAGLAGAAAAIAIAVPVALKLSAGTPAGYANARVEVQTVSVDSAATVHPVVMETDNGDAVIWMVESTAGKKDGGEEGEEDRSLEPTRPQKAGDL